MAEQLVDMHIHTNASDGTWTVDEVLELIIKNNIKVFSITDHNTIINSVKMKNIVPKDINFIIGTEISSTYKGQEYHITAYDFNHEDEKLNELLEFNQRSMNDYNRKTVEYLKDIRKIDDIQDYYSYEYDICRGGWKSLNYLIDKDIIQNMNEYFQITASYNEKAYFKNPKEIIETIRQAGGHSFLAHPSAYVKGNKLGLEILKEWKDYGISGIECYSPYLKDMEDANYYLRFCQDNNLMISAGSDCHGGFNDRRLGIPKVNMSQVKMDFVRNANGIK